MLRYYQQLYGRFSKANGAEFKGQLWDQIIEDLNFIGPEKSLKQWKRCWGDLKKTAKQNLQAIRSHDANNGACPTVLTDQDQKIINICSMEALDGLPVKEYGISSSNDDSFRGFSSKIRCTSSRRTSTQSLQRPNRSRSRSSSVLDISANDLQNSTSARPRIERSVVDLSTHGDDVEISILSTDSEKENGSYANRRSKSSLLSIDITRQSKSTSLIVNDQSRPGSVSPTFANPFDRSASDSSVSTNDARFDDNCYSRAARTSLFSSFISIAQQNKQRRASEIPQSSDPNDAPIALPEKSMRKANLQTPQSSSLSANANMNDVPSTSSGALR